MEERKQKEIEHYDQKAKEFSDNESGDFEGLNPFLLESYQFLKKITLPLITGKKVLDYGCGNGVHAVWLAESADELIGIDLSERSLEIAKKRIEKLGDREERAVFLTMDCEKMEFPENYFDIIFDGGTFSSLDLKKVLPEVARVLKPDGFLLGIETLGHNPFTNLKRKISKITGKRTGWATEHIFRLEDLKEAEKYFGKIEVNFFHLTSWIAFLFLSLPGGKLLLKLLEKLDKVLLKLPFLKKYAFKIVFVFSLPR